MNKDEQARARLVEIALADEFMWRRLSEPILMSGIRQAIRKSAGFRDHTSGSWCAAGLTDAMERAGLVVPAPGTPARRGAVALLDFVAKNGTVIAAKIKTGPQHVVSIGDPEPGDLIAWLQHPFGRDPAGWRRGHVALIVAVDDKSITTVGWNEGNAPGRVMKRRLWRDSEKPCTGCGGKAPAGVNCRWCGLRRTVPRSSTVLYRRPGGLYGIARPVAR